MTADVTVISVFYNRARSVDLSMTSLLGQDYRDSRIVVVDDGSTDDSFAALSRYRSPSVDVRSQANSGFTATIGRIASEVETEFIAIHGAGDESLPQRIGRQRALLKSNPNIVAVGCGIQNVDTVNDRRWDVYPRQALLRGPMTSGFGISHGELMIRTDAYRRAGGYRAQFRYGQATDLLRRLSRLGDFGYVEEILYRRYLMGDGVNADLRKLAQRDMLEALSRAVHERQADIPAETSDQPLVDDLDRYELLLPYLLPPNRHVAVSLARAAIKYWAAGDRDIALTLASKAVREAPSPRTLACYIAVKLGIGPMRQVMRSIAFRASSGVAEMDLERLSRAALLKGPVKGG